MSCVPRDAMQEAVEQLQGKADLLVGDRQGRRQRHHVLIVAADVQDESVALALDLEIALEALIDHAIDQARQHFGSLDLLFLNAGISRPGPIESTDEDAFDALFDINVKGNFFTLQKALPLLHEGASVVFTVGAGEVLGAAMTAAKGALVPLMRALALELAPRGIRVNAVSPGLINTPAYSKVGVSQDLIESWAQGVPLGRVGTPADVAEVVAFLASDAASYLTGDNLSVSGGIGIHPRP